jgi:hypothetical protein
MRLGYTMGKSLQGDTNYLESQNPMLVVSGELNGHGLLSL